MWNAPRTVVSRKPASRPMAQPDVPLVRREHERWILFFESAAAEASAPLIRARWPLSPSQDVAGEKRRLGLHELTSERALVLLRACLARWRTGGWLGLLVRPTWPSMHPTC